MKDKLEEYTVACVKLDKPEDEAQYRKALVKCMLHYLVYKNQGTYLRHLESKRKDQTFEKDLKFNNKANHFMKKLLHKSLTLSEYQTADAEHHAEKDTG